jgi:hypothetical protein
MLVIDFLNMAYKKGKNGLSKLAINFMMKHDLKENMEVSEEKLILLSQHLSNKEKKIKIITALLEIVSNKASTKTKSTVGEWRNSSYKQVTRELHPDSDTGTTEAFQFLQEIKEYLWDYKGEPRKEIKKSDWKREKMLADGWSYNMWTEKYEKKGE